jgi:unsaturated chondroitin disaccharide hydrolase
MLWDGYNTFRDDWYRNAALDANRRMLGGEDRELHITGLNFWNASVRSYRETGDATWRQSALKCADMMVRIADPLTGLIPEYGPAVRRRPDDPYDQSNYVKIDALVGLPILWWAYEETRDKRYLDAASRHMKATMDTLIEPDGAALQMLWQDPRSGEILGIATHQGYGGNSRWARGLSWILDGMPDAYRATKDEKYRAQFERSARWFEENLPEDLISWYDFDDQAVFWRYRDSSTSAICAYGLLRMSELEPDAALAARYRALGTRVVNALIDRCLTPVGAADSRPPGMLVDATYTKPNKGEFIWGNYSLVRSLCWLKSKGSRR